MLSQQMSDVEHLAKTLLAFRQVTFDLSPHIDSQSLVDVGHNLLRAEVVLPVSLGALGHTRPRL
jgi:hypothetical protein